MKKADLLLAIENFLETEAVTKRFTILYFYHITAVDPWPMHNNRSFTFWAHTSKKKMEHEPTLSMIASSSFVVAEECFIL